MRATISVVIPAYNAAAFVGEAIDSLTAQRVPVSELVVVDDGSTDGTADAARAALERTTIPSSVICQRNGGVPVARNAGLLRTTGDLVAFLDADDILLPDHFERIVAGLSAHPEAPMAYSDMVEFDAGGDRTGSLFSRTTERRATIETRDTALADVRLLGAGLTASLLVGNFIPPSATVIRRASLARAGAFDPAFWIGEDRDLFLRLSLLGPFVEINAITGRHRIHPGSTMATRDDRRWAFTSLQILAAFRSRFPAQFDDPAVVESFDQARRKWYTLAMELAARRGIAELRGTARRCRQLGDPDSPTIRHWIRALGAELIGRRGDRSGSA